jgi:hypothetical protein
MVKPSNSFLTRPDGKNGKEWNLESFLKT